VQDLTVDPAATLSLNGFALTATRNVDATGFVLEPGTVVLSGSGTTVQGYLPSLQVLGSVTVVNNLTVTVDLDVVGSGSFDLGTSSFVQVNGSFSTSGTATIQMNNGSALFVNGSATFDGGSESGKLTDGTLELLGNFSQSRDTESFDAGHALFTVLLGTGTQCVNFAYDGLAAGTSHFGGIDVLNAGGGVSLCSPAFASGALFATPSGQGLFNLISGNGHTLTTKGIFVDSLTIDNMPLVVDSSATQFIGLFDHVTFRNFSDPAAIQLDVTGTTGTYVFNNLQFLGTPPNPGYHLRANDPVVGNGQFTITLVAPSPSASTAQRTTTGEAVINWP
jgi:hypothetical protein